MVGSRVSLVGRLSGASPLMVLPQAMLRSPERLSPGKWYKEASSRTLRYWFLGKNRGSRATMEAMRLEVELVLVGTNELPSDKAKVPRALLIWDTRSCAWECCGLTPRRRMPTWKALVESFSSMRACWGWGLKVSGSELTPFWITLLPVLAQLEGAAVRRIWIMAALPGWVLPRTPRRAANGSVSVNFE